MFTYGPARLPCRSNSIASVAPSYAPIPKPINTQTSTLTQKIGTT